MQSFYDTIIKSSIKNALFTAFCNLGKKKGIDIFMKAYLDYKRYTLTDFIRITFMASPVATILRAGDAVLFALLPVIQVIVTAQMIDNVGLVLNGEASVNTVYMPLVGIGILLFLINMNKQVLNMTHDFIEMKLAATYKSEILIKRAKLKYKNIENNAVCELINRTCERPEYRMLGGFVNIMDIFTLFVQVISLLVIIVTKIWWVGAMIVVISVPLFLLSMKVGEETYETNKEAEKHIRRAKYYQKVIMGRENVEERTLFGYTSAINQEWYKKFEDARKIKAYTELHKCVRTKGASIITTFLSMIIVGTLIIPLNRGEITSGLFIAMCTAVLELIQVMSWTLSFLTDFLAQNKKYLEDLTDFMALEEEKGVLGVPRYDAIEPLEMVEFENVTFRYPDTETYILKNFSLKILKNKHYAIVGINGCGKTTLTKLLLGLYSEFEGNIFINGKDIREYSKSELKAYFSVVFQDFARYGISINDNVAIGNMQIYNSKKVEKAKKILGLDQLIDKMPRKGDTILGKVKEEGVDLSGGQWQKVAVARAIVSNAEVCILDEPTAALDPVAESNMYEMFDNISKGKTTIFITHRLGAAKLADNIIVIDNGTVCEEGSHDKLMRLNGIYAQMYISQRSWYEDEGK